jgi:valyl-tRNA synthetase
MPVAEHPHGRHTDYVVFMGDVIRWIVEQELKAAGHEPSETVQLDLNAERARLAKEIQKLDVEVGKIDAKLGNADFIKRAPEEVVEEQRERREEALTRKAKMEEALGRLKEA